MDQETLNAVFRRAVREGNFEDVKKYIAQGADVRDPHYYDHYYDLALEGGHKDIVEYLHICGLPDLRSAKLLSLIAHGHTTLAAEAIKAGAVPTTEHLAVANEAMRPLLETAMGAPVPVPVPAPAPAPVSDEYRIPVELVFTRTGTVYVKMPNTLKKVPSYVVDGTYRTSFTYTLKRCTQGPADLPQPVPPEPRVLRLRSRKITYTCSK